MLAFFLLACRDSPAPLPGTPAADTTADTGPVDTAPPDTGPTASISESTISGTPAGATLGWRVSAEPGAVWASAPGVGCVYRFDEGQLTGDVDASAPRLVLQGGGYFGFGLAVSGGVAAVGAPGEDAVYLFAADSTGAIESAQAEGRATGPDAGSSFGVYIVPGASAGTFLIAATDDDSDGVAGGAVYRLSSAAPSEFSAVVTADTAGQQVGTGMAEADLNGDGQPDLIIGGGSEGIGNSGEGDVAVFWGPLAARATMADADLRLRGVHQGEHLGNKVAAGEDLDQDGYIDLAAAAYWNSERAPRGGAAYVLLGPLDHVSTLADADATVRGEGEYGYGGISLAMLPDATGDGVPELLIGEYGAADGDDVVGAAHLFSGLPAQAAVLADATATMWGAAPGGAFGYTLGGGDIDQSGRVDLIVSAYLADEGAGVVQVFPGESLTPGGR